MMFASTSSCGRWSNCSGCRVNILMISVIYQHTESVAGWNKYEMMLLVGTSMLIQRFLMGFFWSSIFEMGRNIRTGNFDFFLAQPGNVMFMATTRKLDPDGLINSFVAMAVVAYSAHQLQLHPSFADIALYAVLVVLRLVIHYSILVLTDLAVVLDHERARRGGRLFHADGVFAAAARSLQGRGQSALRLGAARGRRQQLARPHAAPRIRSQLDAVAVRRRGRSGLRSRFSFSIAVCAVIPAPVHERSARSACRLVSGYTFRDPSLLERAFTHPSYLPEHPEVAESNQRLEFLGDAVLQLDLDRGALRTVSRRARRRVEQAPRGPRERRISRRTGA